MERRERLRHTELCTAAQGLFEQTSDICKIQAFVLSPLNKTFWIFCLPEGMTWIFLPDAFNYSVALLFSFPKFYEYLN